MKRLFKYATFLVSIMLMLALVFSVGAFATPSDAPTGYDLRTESNADKSYDLCGGTLTLDFSNRGKTLDWTSTVPVEKVIYKSGTQHTYYTVNYSPAALSGHIDTSGDNSDFNQIYWYCADEETTTTTTEKPTTTTTEKCTTTTTEEVTTTTEPETTTTTEKETTTTTQPETTTTTEPETTTTTVPETTTTTQPVTTTTEPETPTTVTLVQTDDGQVIGSIWSNPVFLVVSGLVLIAFLTITGAALLKTRFDKK